jgi:hypothetical protein
MPPEQYDHYDLIKELVTVARMANGEHGQSSSAISSSLVQPGRGPFEGPFGHVSCERSVCTSSDDVPRQNPSTSPTFDGSVWNAS